MFTSPLYDLGVTWLEFDSLVNARDVGGLPTTDGDTIRPGRLVRSDNLQDLTRADVARLLQLRVTDVIDLRSAYEVHHEGPGPLVGHPGVRIHYHSFIAERHDRPVDAGGEDELPGDVLPFKDKVPSIRVADSFASTYLSFVAERPESVVGALRAIAYAEGAALVHCAAGKDRTGTAVALALVLAGAEPTAVVADYARSSERMKLIVDRLISSETYRENLSGRSLDSHMTRPDTMHAFLAYAEAEHGGVEPMLSLIGWTSADTAAMRAKLRG